MRRRGLAKQSNGSEPLLLCRDRELGVEAAGLSILVNNELVPNRCAIYRENHPSTYTICGDIWEKEDEILSAWREQSPECPFLIYATPPCQGMSSNGAGKLRSEIRQGNRHPDDPRNRLILPTVHIVKALARSGCCWRMCPPWAPP